MPEAAGRNVVPAHRLCGSIFLQVVIK